MPVYRHAMHVYDPHRVDVHIDPGRGNKNVADLLDVVTSNIPAAKQARKHVENVVSH